MRRLTLALIVLSLATVAYGQIPLPSPVLVPAGVGGTSPISIPPPSHSVLLYTFDGGTFTQINPTKIQIP